MDSGSIEVIYKVWEQCRNSTGVNILGYCLMQNHIHFILWSEHGTAIRQFLHTMTALTSKKLQKGGDFWKERPRIFPIYSRKVFMTKLDYMHQNPVRAGLVADPADWPDSSYKQLVFGYEDKGFRCDNFSILPLV